MFDKEERQFTLVSFSDDQPSELRGALIPQFTRQAKKNRTNARFKTVVREVGRIAAASTAVGALLFAFVSLYGSFGRGVPQVAAPIVTLVSPETGNEVSLVYGPQPTFTQKAFFADMRDAFIDESLSFIEVDLDARTLRYFKDGILLISADIEAVGEQGSWWDAPAGLYAVEERTEQLFSAVAQVEFPFAVTFEGNYLIHGTPRYPDGTAVSEPFKSGGIRISDDKAKELFAVIEDSTPVLVHKKPAAADAFVYEPAVPDIKTTHYLIADVENGAILAASDMNTPVPIASLTKLMTAVVAAEKLDLDSRVRVTTPTFVQSLIPRLSERTSVSMYSLLQLLLVESSNEAAEVIAGEYGREAFIAEMNVKATQLGMLSSKFADPSGLSADNVSTLRDLFTLTQYIHKNRSFIFDITVTGEVETIAGLGEFANLQNFNDIEGVEEYIGGKVGETQAAGQTSVSVHTMTIKGTKRTVAIILLGSQQRSADVRLLVDFVRQRFGQ